MTAEIKDQPKTKTILSPDEGRAYFEEAIPSMLGITAEEFLRLYDAGAYDDLPDSPEYWQIDRAIYLISLARPDS